ncbi:MAG: hypothetical protein ACKVU4_02050 [Phycisphaerales bacterium]
MGAVRPNLVIADGDMTGLLASAAAARADDFVGSPELAEGSVRRSGSAVWVPPFVAAGAREAALRHAELFGLAVVESVEEPAIVAGRGGDFGLDGPRESRLLLDAVSVARGAGLGTVIWPIHAGERLDLDTVARAVDRGLLVARLAAIDGVGGAGAPIGVDVPYADFTDEQVAELALDMDLPVSTCWWWSGGGERGAAARARWSVALRAVGWTDAPVPAVTLRVDRAKPATT